MTPRKPAVRRRKAAGVQVQIGKHNQVQQHINCGRLEVVELHGKLSQRPMRTKWQPRVPLP